MKLLLISLLVTLNIYADDIQRVDRMLNGMTKQSTKNINAVSVDNQSAKELSRTKKLLKKEQEKSRHLKSEIQSLKQSNKALNSNIKKSGSSSSKEISNLDTKYQQERDKVSKLNQKIEKILKEKKHEISAMKSSYKLEKNAQNREIQSLKNEISKKSKVVQKSSLVQKSSSVKKSQKSAVSSVVVPLSSTYRIKGNSPIYDAINGDKVAEWENTTSFTSNVQENGWIKITGYFIEKKWNKSQESLWVKESNTIKR